MPTFHLVLSSGQCVYAQCIEVPENGSESVFVRFSETTSGKYYCACKCFGLGARHLVCSCD